MIDETTEKFVRLIAQGLGHKEPGALVEILNQIDAGPGRGPYSLRFSDGTERSIKTWIADRHRFEPEKFSDDYEPPAPLADLPPGMTRG